MAIKKPLLQKPATGTSSGDYSSDSDYYDDVSETPEVPRKREGKGRSRRGSMAQPAASGAGASAKHVRRSRDSHSHKKPVTGGASSSGAAKTTGTGVPRYSLKKPVTDGKRKGTDDGKPQLPLAQPAQPASGGKQRGVWLWRWQDNSRIRSRPLAAKREVPRIRKRPLAAKLRRFRGRSRTRLAARAPRTRIAAVAAETTLVVHRIHRHLRALRPESAARPLAAETTPAAIAVHLRPEGRFLMVFKVASTSQVARRPLAATRCCSGSGHWISC